MISLPPITLRLRGFKLIDRVALAFLLLCSIALGAACGLLFVYASDLPEIRALETYRPTVVTEIYADDGQMVGSFALQRRILMTYEQVPRVLYNAVTAIEDQHFEDHWGIDFPRMAEKEKIPPTEESATRKTPLGVHIQYPRNDLAPYFFEDIRKYLESTYGTEAVHERGLRIYTTLNIAMQRAANQSVRDGLHSYDRRHGWRANLPNIIRDNLGTIATYEDDDWRRPIEKGTYTTGLVLSVEDKNATIKIGNYRAILSPADFAWTGRKKASDLLKSGDLAQFSIQELRETTARVQLEQQPGPQGAMVAIDNPTGEIKAMVGGYSFEDSKFNRVTQAYRQVGSSFKIYVYADALEKGATPFDTILEAPFTTVSGGQSYSPRNYDEKFEGKITFPRALPGSRTVPAVKLAEKVGIASVVSVTRRFGITTSLPPYLPLALGSADMRLLEHVSAFTVFPNDGIRIDPHMIRRVTSYDGALLEEAHPTVHDVVTPEVARTMTAMLEEVIQFGTGIQAKSLGRPAAGKTGTTQDYTDAWFIGFTPQITSGVWVGYDDKQISLGKKETGARAALPIWLEFMQGAVAGKPVMDFPNVVPLEQQAGEHHISVDTPDTASTEDEPRSPKEKPPAVIPPPPPVKTSTSTSTAVTAPTDVARP